MREIKFTKLFAKRYPNELTAAELRRRTSIARLGGLLTPEVISITENNTIQFERIEGESGIDLIHKTPLSELLAPLVHLHKVSQSNLPRFDPFLRIDPRVSQYSLPRVLVQEIEKRKQFAFSATSVVHGDFHLGQLIKDSSSHCWLIDLDDLALGPAEADLGNLAANLATHSETGEGPISESLKYWENEITTAWVSLGQDYCKNDFQYYSNVALIRRALKRLESGDDSLVSEYVGTLLAP